jgi:hypothetical protein
MSPKLAVEVREIRKAAIIRHLSDGFVTLLYPKSENLQDFRDEHRQIPQTPPRKSMFAGTQ